jgi:hypothetical protein
MVDPNSSQISCQASVPQGAAIPLGGTNQIQAFLDMLPETGSGSHKVADYAQLLNAIADRLEGVEQQGQTPGVAPRLDVIAQNIRAAASKLTDPNSLPTLSSGDNSAGPKGQVAGENEVVVLKNCKMHRVVPLIPMNTRFTPEELFAFGIAQGGPSDKAYALKQFDDLVRLGALNRDSDGKLCRSNRPVFLPPPSRAPQVRSEPLHARPVVNRVTTNDVIAALRQSQSIMQRDVTLPYPYGTDPQDGLRLAVAVACGISLQELCTAWSNPVILQDLVSDLRQVSGMGPKDLMTAVKNELIAHIDQELKSKVLSVAKAQSAQYRRESSSASAGEADEALATLLLRVGTLITQNAPQFGQEDIAQMNSMLGVTEAEIQQFMTGVLTTSSRHLPQPLQDPAVRAVFDPKPLQYLSGTQSLESVASQFGVHKQVVSMQVMRLKNHSPWLVLLADARRKGPNTPPVSDCIRAEFEEALRKDPAALFTAAKKVDSNPAQLESETDDDYHRRLMLAAYSGAYNKPGPFPEALEILGRNPKKYFTDLVDQCVNDRINAAIEEYTLKIDDVRMRDIRCSLKLPVRLDNAETIRQVIETLISNPRTAVDKLLGEIGFSDKVFMGRKSLFDSLVREYAKPRAVQICKVFDEEWYQPWKMAELKWVAMQTRYVQQRSLAEGATLMNITSHYYNATCNALMAKFPGLKRVAARAYMVHTKQ